MIIFLLSLFFVFSIKSMDWGDIIQEKNLTKTHITSQKNIPLFDTKKERNKGNAWQTSFSDKTILIAPDEKTIIASLPRKVYSFSIYSHDKNMLSSENPNTTTPNLFFKHNKSVLIIKHPNTKHVPILAIASTLPHNKLLVVSAGNYCTSENTKEGQPLRIAECIIYHDDKLSIKNFNWPLQAISLNKDGTKLAIANKDTIGLFTIQDYFNLENPDFDSPFKTHQDLSYFMDIALSEKGEHLVATQTNGSIRLYSTNNGLQHIKTVTCRDTIKHIHFPICESFKAMILYTTSTQQIKTNDHQIKTIDLYKLLESTSELHGEPFSPAASSEHAIYDSGWNIATAHWVTKKLSYDERKQIEIYRTNNNRSEILTLEAPTLEKKYDYINQTGQLAKGNGHFLTVAMRNNRVVALGTDGKLYSWQLPPIKKFDQNITTTTTTTIEDYTTNQTKKEESDTPEQITSIKTKRRGSNPLSPFKLRSSSKERTTEKIIEKTPEKISDTISIKSSKSSPSSPIRPHITTISRSTPSSPRNASPRVKLSDHKTNNKSDNFK